MNENTKIISKDQGRKKMNEQLSCRVFTSRSASAPQSARDLERSKEKKKRTC